jgi:diamine N-acetyltransferase
LLLLEGGLPVSRPRVATITPDNVEDVCGLHVKPHQNRYVAPVVHSLALAYAYGEHAWPRIIVDDSEIVAFVMCGFKARDPFLHSTIWRLNVAADAQRCGYGRIAVRAAAREAQRRGRATLFTSYVKGKGSPEGFYLKLGFEPTGRTLGEIHEAAAPVAELLT